MNLSCFPTLRKVSATARSAGSGAAAASAGNASRRPAACKQGADCRSAIPLGRSASKKVLLADYVETTAQSLLYTVTVGRWSKLRPHPYVLLAT